jgi:hypothetical protein
MDRLAGASLRLARLALVVLIAGAAVASCGSSSVAPDTDPTLRILFIGNSLTYANDLPATVQHLGQSDPNRAVVVSSVAVGGFSLEDHWSRSDAQQAIASARWDLVVLQQGPSALPESRALLIDYATRFAGEIRKVGGRPAMYMVWPGLDREAEWGAVSASYAAAAEAVDGLLFPAGEALRAVRAAAPSIPLFEADGFHPSMAGTYGAALVIYARAAGVSPVGLTARAGGSTLPPGYVTALEAGAAQAIAEAGGD